MCSVTSAQHTVYRLTGWLHMHMLRRQRETVCKALSGRTPHGMCRYSHRKQTTERLTSCPLTTMDGKSPSVGSVQFLKAG